MVASKAFNGLFKNDHLGISKAGTGYMVVTKSVPLLSSTTPNKQKDACFPLTLQLIPPLIIKQKDIYSYKIIFQSENVATYPPMQN